eukprot:12713310-Alexandrium_andersonii.AAC.1
MMGESDWPAARYSAEGRRQRKRWQHRRGPCDERAGSPRILDATACAEALDPTKERAARDTRSI